MDQNSAGKIPVIDVAKEAYSFFAANWTKLLPAAGIAAAVAAAAMTLLAGPTAAVSPVGFMLAGAISGVAGIAYAAVVLRLVLRGEFVGPVGLTLGADELRLIGVTAGLMLAFLPPVMLSLLAFSFIVIGRMQLTPERMQELANDPEAMQRAMEEALGPGGMAAMSVAMLLGLLVLMWFGARLFMVQAATIGEKRMVAFQTWAWSRGNVGRVILALVLTLAPPMLVATIITEFVWGAVGQALSPVVYLLVLALTTFVDLIAQIPSVALAATLYRGLRPPDFKPK